MERHELLALMMELHLAGMRAIIDEVLRDAVRRERSFADLLGDLLKAELAQKKARSISYQIGAAHLPVAKELTEFVFDQSPVNETLVRDLHGGGFLETKRNAVLIVLFSGPNPRLQAGKASALALDTALSHRYRRGSPIACSGETGGSRASSFAPQAIR